jgi:hypothetical protein
MHGENGCVFSHPFSFCQGIDQPRVCRGLARWSSKLRQRHSACLHFRHAQHHERVGRVSAHVSNRFLVRAQKAAVTTVGTGTDQGSHAASQSSGRVSSRVHRGRSAARRRVQGPVPAPGHPCSQAAGHWVHWPGSETNCTTLGEAASCSSCTCTCAPVIGVPACFFPHATSCQIMCRKPSTWFQWCSRTSHPPTPSFETI